MVFRSLASSCLLAFSLALTGCAGSADDSVSDEAAAESAGAGHLAREYKGTVAGRAIMMRLDATSAAVTGSYFYVGQVTKGETIALSGAVAGGHFAVEEKVGTANTGAFSGTLAASGAVRGTWTAPSGRKESFSLEPVKSVTVVPRAIKDKAQVADKDAPFHECYVNVQYLDVFGLPDATLEATLDQALAIDAAPLDKNAQGKCDWWNSVDSSGTVKLQEKGLLVVEQSAEYDGGAYPNHSLMWVNASTKTGKVLTLVDLVKADQMKALMDKTIAVYKASPDGVDDFFLETIQTSFQSPETVQFELTKEGLRISMFNALPHAAQAEDGDGAMLKWSEIRDMIIPTSDAAVLLP